LLDDRRVVLGERRPLLEVRRVLLGERRPLPDWRLRVDVEEVLLRVLVWAILDLPFFRVLRMLVCALTRICRCKSLAAHVIGEPVQDADHAGSPSGWGDQVTAGEYDAAAAT
jgi:hypothetical protein